MKVLTRFLRIVVYCRLLGRHAPLTSIALPDGVEWQECRTCRSVIIRRRNAHYMFKKPSIWDIAHGFYDGDHFVR